MAVAFVGKGTRAAFGGGSSAAPSKTGVTAGNLVVLSVGFSRGDTANTAIAAPSGWTAAQNPAGPAIGGSPNYTPVVAIFYKLSSAGGTESATVAGPGGSYGWAQISEFSGGPFTFTGAQSAHAEFNTTATSRATGTTGANSIADAVAIAVGHPEDTTGSTAALTTPATWTNLDLEATNSAEVAWSSAYKLLSSTGAQSATHTWTGASYYAGAIAIFEGPSGGAGDHPVDGAGGIATGQAIGSASIGATVAAAGIATGQAIGAPSIGAGVTAAGIVSAAALGSPTIGAGINVTGSGIASGEAIGAPSIGGGIVAAGIPTGEAMGAPTLAAGIGGAGGTASGEAVGAPSIGGGIVAAGIASGEAAGSPALAAGIGGAGGVASGEAVGAPVVAGDGVFGAGIPSAAAIGQPALGAGIVAAGVPSAEALGQPVIGTSDADPIVCVGIASAEQFGLPRVGDYLFVRTAQTHVARVQRRAFRVPSQQRALQVNPQDRTYKATAP